MKVSNALFAKIIEVVQLLHIPTAAVVYSTVACIYTGQEVTFKMVMRVVPKFWKRLVIISACAFAAIFACTMGTLLTIAGTRIFMINRYILAIGFVLLVLFFMGVVSVSEEACGMTAMIKSKALVRGKTKVMGVILLTMTLSYVIMKI
ncbi:hypothetical protein NC651_013918 [Populus alba x Populus x berolinensis]|nr:hypothetical protein NC651_013918 [Populus alba x Populus x berolinensis]